MQSNHLIIIFPLATFPYSEVDYRGRKRKCQELGYLSDEKTETKTDLQASLPSIPASAFPPAELLR